VHAVPVTATLHEAVELAMHCGNTRLPVYEDDIDNICGVLYAKDLLRFLDNPDGFSTRDVMREPLYVPETCSCADVFTHMQQQRTQFAVVVDEYGGTYGIVTMEDLLETIVGTIEEEYNEAESGFTPAGDNVWLLDASLGLSEVEVRLDIRFPDDSEADTIGGYLAEQLGYDRSEGAPTSVTVDNYRFSIAQSDDRRIHTVRAERLPEESEEK
jgi:putative hemolysin